MKLNLGRQPAHTGVPEKDGKVQETVRPDASASRINTTAKGNRRQNACRKQLEADGWLTHVARRGYKGQKIDIFGLFDIVAYRAPRHFQAGVGVGDFTHFDTFKENACIKLIQVKSNRCDTATREAIKAFIVDGVIVRKEIWIYADYSRQGPKIEEVE